MVTSMRVEAPSRAASMRRWMRDLLLWVGAYSGIDSAIRAVSGGGVIRVMNMHGTPRRDASALRRQLQWATSNFDVLRPSELLDVLSGRLPAPRRPSLAFTFDDGLASNAEVAAPLLEEFGIRAIFFVSPSFIGLSGAAALQFFTGNIRPQVEGAALEEEDYTPMTWDMARRLQGHGHVIGSHTATHVDLRRVSGATLDAEVRGAREELARALGAPVDCFAWTFAWNAVTAEAWRVAMDCHRYCFTPCPGSTRPGDSARVWRINVEPAWPAHWYRGAYSGLVESFWYFRRRRLAAMHRKLTSSPALS